MRILVVIALLLAATAVAAWFVLADESPSPTVSIPVAPSRIETEDVAIDDLPPADAASTPIRTATSVDVEPDEPKDAPAQRPSTGKLVVRVVDSDSRPIPGASVVAFDRAGPSDEVAEAHTGPDGIATLAVAAGVRHRVTARAEIAGAVLWGDVEPAAANDDVRIVVVTTVTQRGRILDAKGSPVEGAVVVLESGPHSEFTRTSATGAFEFVELTPDPAQLEVLAAGHERLRVAITPSPVPVDLTLRAGTRMRGVVVDAESGAAIAAADVTITARRKVAGSTVQVVLDRGHSDASGSFAWATTCVDGVTLTARADGYAAAAIELDDDDGTASVRLELTRSRTLRATARLADGSPASGARVVLLGLEHFQARTRKTRAADDGSFVVDEIDARAEFRVVVSHQDAAPVVLVDSEFPRERPRDVVLPTRNRVTGVVTSATGTPWTDGHVVLEPAASGIASAAKAAKVATTTWTDAQGRFVFEGLPEGAYRISGRSADATLDVLEFTLAPGESKSLRGTVATAAWIEGLAIDENAAPVPQARIRVVERHDDDERVLAEVLTGADGRFRAAVPQRDDASLHVIGEADGRAERELGPTAAPVSDLVLVLPALGRCRGRVLDATTGRPIPAFALRIDAEPIGTLKRSLHAPDGTFAIDELEVGTADVTVRADGYRTLGPRSIAITTDATVHEFALTPCAELEGRLATAAGAGCGGLRVTVMRGDDALRSTHARSDGTFRLRDLDPGRCALVVGDLATPLARIDDVDLAAGMNDAGVVLLNLDGALSIRVVRAGAPVPDASVRVEGFATKSVLKLACDPSGIATAEPLPADRYRVKVEGHVTEVDVRAGARSEVVITLPEESA